MPTPIDPKRLPRLRAALRKAKDGDKLPQQELAKIYDVSNARLTTLIKQRFETFPPAERRGDKTHWYEVKPALQAMIDYLEGTGKRKQAAAAQAARMLGGEAVAPVTPTESETAPTSSTPEALPLPSPADLDRTANAAIKIWRLAQEKGEFVPVALVRAKFRDLFGFNQRFLSSLPTEIDPNGELPPLLRARLEASIRDAQVRLHGAVADMLPAEREADAA